MSCFQRIDNKKEWQNLLAKTLFKTFFHNLEWEEFLERSFGWLRFERYLYKNEALLSLARAKVFGKEKLVSHPFCEYGGPLPLVNSIDGKAFEKDLFSEFKSQVRIQFHPYLLGYFSIKQEIPKDQILSTFLVEDLHQKTENQLWTSFRKTLRHSIKKAQGHNLEVKKCEDEKELRAFYNIYLKVEKKHKAIPYPFSFFQYYFQSPNSEIVLAKLGNKVVAGSVFLFYDKFIHYSKNASDARYQNLNVNSLILWWQLKKYAGGHFEVFDLGGTGKGSSLEIFKRAWGGREYPIFEISNRTGKKLARRIGLRKVFGILPGFFMEKLSSYLLKYKI